METVFDYAHTVLNTTCSREKARLTLECWEKFQNNEIQIGNAEESKQPPVICARPDYVQRVAAGKMRKRKTSIKLVHALAHIESYAIDLSWDVLLRFAKNRLSGEIDHILNGLEREDIAPHEYVGNRGVSLPDEFYADWLKVAADEARHFMIWDKRLKEIGSFYGELPGHDGLWKDCQKTQHDVLARLAILHMVQEGHGLDVNPALRKKLRKIGDKESAELCEIIERDEVTHVAAGVKWFRFVAKELGLETKEKFQEIVRTLFVGKLKPPFNFEARDSADFPRDWYLPLARK